MPPIAFPKENHNWGGVDSEPESEDFHLGRQRLSEFE